jgi:[ribosomal protein S5]-alanine N-acetyltransferase
MTSAASAAGNTLLLTARLELRPLPAAAAAVLSADRLEAARLIGVELADDWPQPDLLDVLPAQAKAGRDEEPFGAWLLVERASRTVVGDAGFIGPPDEDGTLEIGYGVVPSRRRRRYATEAVAALVEWALAQPRVRAVVAECDRDNEPSIRVLERAGFVRTDEQDGKVRWRLDGLT